MRWKGECQILTSGLSVLPFESLGLEVDLCKCSQNFHSIYCSIRFKALVQWHNEEQ